MTKKDNQIQEKKNNKIVTVLATSDLSQLRNDIGNVKAAELIFNLRKQFVGFNTADGKLPANSLEEFLIDDSLEAIENIEQQIKQSELEEKGMGKQSLIIGLTAVISTLVLLLLLYLFS